MQIIQTLEQVQKLDLAEPVYFSVLPDPPVTDEEVRTYEAREAEARKLKAQIVQAIQARVEDERQILIAEQE